MLKKYWPLIIPVLIVIAVLVLVKSTKKGDNPKSEVAGLQATVTSTPESKTMDTSTPSGTQTQAAELKIEDITVGTGDTAVAGKSVTVNYSGTLTDGKKFDSSYDRNTPFTFNLGAGEVIKGWDEGVVGMKVGGKRKLTIPASMGYGAAGAPPVIPGNATLIFEVELLKVE